MSGGIAGRRARRGLRRTTSLAGTGLAALSVVGMALAQDGGAPNPALIFDLGLGLEVDDDDAALTADLGLSYLTRTRTQNLEFTLGTSAEIDGNGLGDDAFRPSAGLSYTLDGGNAVLTLGARYSLREVDGLALAFDPLDDDLDAVTLVDDDGLLETVRASASLDLFRRDPVGLELGASVLERDYRDTADPDLDDSRSRSATAALRLTPRPGLDFRLTAARTASEDEGDLETETETTSLGGRVTWAATPGTTLDLALSQTEREETRNAFAIVNDQQVLTGGRETVTSDGLTFSGSVTQARPNGTRSLSFSRELTDDGNITTVQLGRALALAGGGDLSLRLGASRFETGGTVVTGSLNYGQELAGGAALTAAFTRSAGTDAEDQEVARSRASLGLSRPLTPVSRIGLSAALARVEVVDGFERDETGLELSARYSRALSEDWSLTAGYTYQASRVDGSDTESDNRFTLGVSRRFLLRP